MSTEGDRRAQGASRIPFEALVEVGGAAGPAFEAQAVNVSEDGMQLRTAYLPEAGQPLTCRFDAGPGESVLVSGEVVWAQQAGKGGEFGIRFSDLDAESEAALKKMIGLGSGKIPQQLGSRVRLHIEGLNSPMRARVKGTERAEIVVGSDLGFLQVGKELHLEDATSGAKRPARIDAVNVEVDGASHVPQLVVTLHYVDMSEAAPPVRVAAASVTNEARADAGDEGDEGDDDSNDEIAESEPQAGEAAHVRSNREDDLESVKKASHDMKGAIARGASKIAPAFSDMAKRAKTTFALLAAKRASRADEATPARRTTSPAPGGGLHTNGRRVVRGERVSTESQGEANMPPKFTMTKRKVAFIGAALLALILAVVALRKSSAQPTAAGAADTTAARTKPNEPTAGPAIAPPGAAIPAGDPGLPGAADEAEGAGPSSDPGEAAGAGKPGKKGKVTPFGSPVTNANMLTLKMDGPIEKIQGAQQPTGFTVQVPGRRSLEAAGPLAARDPRIGSVKVSNDPAGAELTIAFKDGVPRFQVRAKGDVLEIALAPVGKGSAKAGDKKVAKKGNGKKGKKKDKKPDAH